MALPVFDGHNDVLLAERSFLEPSEDGHLDLARARAGGFAGGFFAIFTPHPDGFPDDSKRGPDVQPEPPVERALALHALGLRSLGITWSRPNAFGHGVPFAAPSTPDTGPGLTDAGRALVRACEELGILVDLGHLNERGFWDVAEITGRPLVVTHACSHALVPSARNLTDAQLDAVGDPGVVVGVCFHYEDAGPQRTDIARQVDHIAARLGPEHVALGSDFDGCELPAEMAGAADLPLVLDDLRALGWAEPELRLVAHENFLRVLRQAQNAASSRASPTGSS
jgi:microsomal dipeptidase-like Zn-dependent dipeptidase